MISVFINHIEKERLPFIFLEISGYQRDIHLLGWERKI